MGFFSSIGHALTHIATDPLRALGGAGNHLADEIDKSLNKIQGKLEGVGKTVAPEVLGAIGGYFGGPAGAALGVAIGDKIQGKSTEQSLIGGVETLAGGELASGLGSLGSSAASGAGTSISTGGDLFTPGVVSIGGSNAGEVSSLSSLGNFLSSESGQLLSTVGEQAASQYAQSFEQSFSGGTDTGSMYGEIGKFLDGIFDGVNNSFSSIGGQIVATIQGMFSNGFQGFLQSVGALSNEVVTGIDTLSGEISDFIRPITTLVGDVDNVVTAVQDKLIAPVTNIITTTETESKELLQGLSNDLHSGLSGLVKIPETIASALTTEGAALQRANETLATDQESIVNDDMVPGLGKVIGSHIQHLVDAFQPAVPTGSTGAERQFSFNIDDQLAADKVVALAGELRAKLNAPDGFWGSIIGWLLGQAESLTAATGIIKADYELGKQAGNATNPIELLGIGEALRARLRGFIKDDEYKAELLRRGISADRADVIYANALWLFDVPRATDMYWRGLIGREEWEGILSQHGMDSDQAVDYLNSTNFLFLPLELVRMHARGIVDDVTFDRGMVARHMNPDQQAALKELAVELPNLHSQIDADRRRLAANIGILHDFLDVPVPDDIKALGNARMIAPEQVENDWINHWDLPNAADWIKAWWRGAVSKGDMEMGFQALGIPAGLWDTLTVLEQQVPPFWYMSEILSAGLVPKDTAIRWLTWEGFSADDAETIYKASIPTTQNINPEVASALTGLTATTAKDLFEDSAIDADTYRSLLVQLGYGEEAAQLTVELEELKIAQTARSNLVDNLVTQAKLGLLDTTNVTTQLYNAGFSTAEVESAILKITNALQTNIKMPTESQINTMLKKGVITADVWMQTMQQFGYTQEWAERIAQII